MRNSIFYKILSVIFIVIVSCFSVACDQSKNNGNNGGGGGGGSSDTNEELVVDGVTINDVFIELKISDGNVNDIDLSELNIESIKIKSADVTEMEIKELEVVSINDEFVYVAYENFVDYYGQDFDLAKFLKDVAIGATVVVVCVALSTVAGPIGKFFGAVITSELSASAICVGAAIDAAISGYKAYQEGGDFSYVLGHMLNGVAEGFKWGAILAPFTGSASGIKALKAVSKLQKMPGFKQYTQKQLSQMLKSMPDIIKATAKCAKNASDDVLRGAFVQAQKNLATEITEDIFIQLFKNQDVIINQIIKKINPYNLASKTVKELKNAFLERNNLTKEVAEEIIKKIKNQSINSLDDLSKYGIDNYAKNNLGEFVEVFGSSFSKQFIESSLKETVSDSVYNAFKNVIGKTKNTYCQLLESIGKSSLDNILTDHTSLLLLQMKFGVKNLNDLLYLKSIYSALLQNNNISHEAIKSVIDGIFNKTVESLDDVAKINTQIAKNMQSARDVVASSIKSLGLGKKSAGLLDDLLVKKIGMHLPNSVSADTISDIVCNSLSKSAIINKYGNELYESLVDRAPYLLGSFQIQNTVNKSLVDSILNDYLLKAGISDNAVLQLSKGVSLLSLDLSAQTIDKIGNVLAEYYRITNTDTYINFIDEFAEIRCQTAKTFNESIGYVPLNGEYASKIKPSTSKYIQDKYGDIYYNSAGYPIFDKYAIARIELPDLNGLEGGSLDIKRANLIHHGTQENVKGYTWHHLEDGKTLILVPTELHDAKVSGYGHSGGAKLLRDGAFGPRG